MTKVVFTLTGKRYHYPERHESVKRVDGCTHAYVGPASVGKGEERITLLGPRTWCGLWCSKPNTLTDFDYTIGAVLNLKPCVRCQTRERETRRSA